MLSYGTSHRCLEKYIIIHVGNCNILKFSPGRFFLQFKIEFKAVCIYFLINFLYRIVQSSTFTLIEKQMGLLLFFFFALGFFSHYIPTRNSANWWVYYCGIAPCFGLGLYHHESNSKPTHDAKGEEQRAVDNQTWLL